MSKDKPKIVSKSKDSLTGLYQIVVLYETKKEGEVRYYYTITNSGFLQAILRKPMLTYTDWNWIQDHGTLTHKDVTKKRS